MPDDRLRDVAEVIKHHHRQHVSVDHPAPGICVSRCAIPWPCQAYRAAAAVDAALNVASEWDTRAAELDCDVTRARKSWLASNQDRVAASDALAETLRGCAKDLREAVGRELTGGGGDSGVRPE